MSEPSIEQLQAAAAAQFDRQSDCYGKSHILADTADVESGIRDLQPLPRFAPPCA
jgi:hypothetical protein